MKKERKRYAAILSAVEENAATNHWYPYTKTVLERRGFSVTPLVMPEPNYPEMEERIAAVHRFLAESKDGDTYLIGHSVGGISILKALESLPKELKKVSGAVFVAALIDHLGFKHSDLGHTEHPERGEELVFGSFFPNGAKPDFRKISKNLRQADVIVSDNDPYIPLSHGETIARELKAAHTTLHGMDHMSTGVTALPAVIDAIERQVRKNG